MPPVALWAELHIIYQRRGKKYTEYKNNRIGCASYQSENGIKYVY